jgi:hypothetical protein
MLIEINLKKKSNSPGIISDELMMGNSSETFTSLNACENTA